MDTLRADFTGMWDARLPFGERFKSGTVFTTASTAGPWTRPSHAALLTGFYPLQTGILDMDHWIKRPLIPDYLPPEYESVAFVSNRNILPDDHAYQHGFHFGFSGSRLNFSDRRRDDFGRNGTWNIYKLHPASVFAASEWLQNRTRSNPFFLFLHCNTVHNYRKGEVEIAKNKDYTFDYMAAASLADNQLGKVLEILDFEKTITIFTSDHGEKLQSGSVHVDHGADARQDLMHVPMVVWLPRDLRRALKPSSRISLQASNVDVLPSILRLLGANASLLSAHFPGHFLFDLPVRRTAVLQDFDNLFWPESKEVYRSRYGAFGHPKHSQKDITELIARFSFPFKHVYRRLDKKHRFETFNLVYDRAEAFNLEASETLKQECLWTPRAILIASSSTTDLQVLRSPVFQICYASRDIPVVYDARPSFNGLFQPSRYFHSLGAQGEVLVVSGDVYLPLGWSRRMIQVCFKNAPADWAYLGGLSSGGHGHWSDAEGYHYNVPESLEVKEIDVRPPNYKRKPMEELGFRPAVIPVDTSFRGWMVAKIAPKERTTVLVDNYFTLTADGDDEF